jgi:parallel beta-helix repeat protein
MPQLRMCMLVLTGIFCLSLGAIVPVNSANQSFSIYLPFVSSERAEEILYVSQRQPASTSADCGSKSNPCATISAAVKKAKAKTRILVEAGTYREQVKLTTSGNSGEPIILSGQAGAKIVSPKKGVAVTVEASHWLIEGFEIDQTGINSAAVSINSGSSNIVLQHNYVHGGLSHGIVLADGSNFNRVLLNEIAYFRASDRSDSHGIAVRESHNNLIEGNRIHHNSGDGVQIFTNDTPELSKKGHAAKNNQIIANQIYENDENAVDIKSSVATVVRNNTFWGSRPALGSDGKSYRSDGMAVVVHYWARDVEISHNTISDSTWGIEVSRGQKGGTRFDNPPSDVRIEHNTISNLKLFTDPKYEADNKGNGSAIVVREANNVYVRNNTIRGAEGYCLAITWPSSGSPSPTPPKQLSITHNDLKGCGLADLYLRSGDLPPSLVIDHNRYAAAQGGRMMFGSTLHLLPAWQLRFGLDLNSLLD